MPERGVCYVAYGEAARREAAESIRSLFEQMDLPVACVAASPLGVGEYIPHEPTDPGARLVKLSLDLLSPFAQTLYLDADTRIRGDLSAGFRLLDDGWDLALAYSTRQGGDVLGNVTAPDRLDTRRALGVDDVLGLQCGVMFWRRCEAVSALFALWREEWRRHKAMDQGAFLRALHVVPVRVWLLGRDWNGGALVEHRFGRARRAA